MADEREMGHVRRVQPNDDRQSRSGGSDDDARGQGSSDPAGEDSSGGKDKSDDSEMVSAYGNDDQDDDKKSGGKQDDQDEDGASGKKSKKSSDPGAEDDDDKKSKKDKKKGGLKERLKQIKKMLAVAKAVHQGMMMAQMLLYMKAFLQMMVAMVQAAAAAIASAIAALVQTVVTVATAVATAVGVSVAVATGGLAVLLLAVVIAVVAVTSTLDNVASKDDGGYNCNTDASYMQAGVPVDAAEQTLANAKVIYAFFKAYGFPDENIAGILGNWQAESRIDPTGTETIFTEAFTLPMPGTRKYDAWKGQYYNSSGGLSGPADYKMVSETSGGNEYGLVSLKSSNNIDSGGVFKRYHATYPAIDRIGIGLGQWTNDRNQMLLDFAERVSMNWYDLDCQLMFMVCRNGGDSRAHMVAGWAAESSPESAARWFYAKWEGGGGGDKSKTPQYRIECAENWYVTIQSWVEGVDYDMQHAYTLLAAVEAAGAMAGDKAGSSDLRNCSGYVYADNSSAAAAAVAFSWGPGDAYDNDGTDCWQHLADAMYGSEVLYRSCDRTVAAALWWSGTDSEFPKNLGSGSPHGQLNYMITSDNWTQVDWGGDFSKLLPGDVLIRCDELVGHIVMYVGPDVVKAKFGETYNGHDSSKYVFVSGSAGEYSPHVGGIYRDSAKGFQTYYAFRCVQKQNLQPERSQLTCVS